ncbi:MAG: flagellar biosynthesis repressor FlbT [Rhodospirillaceae bacterium]|nr:flagellar biosynthesis repressor FlbT [Rhodospirillaceae bacterium]|tara:strand:- start:1998 stop:2465 length:468 start_codon:yes stop_codon:yes gene_type:complete
MALKLTLKPGEKFVINGAVIVNGERRSHLLIQNKVSMLREKDVMQQSEANTPVKHIYFAIQMLYLDETNDSSFYDEFAKRIQEFMSAIVDKDALNKCGKILNAVNNGNYYYGLTICKKLLPFERSRLEYFSNGSSDCNKEKIEEKQIEESKVISA